MSTPAVTEPPLHSGRITSGPNGLAWSPGLFGLLGLAIDEFTPSHDLFASFLLPQDRAAGAALVAMLDGSRTNGVTAGIRCRDGTIRRIAALPAETDCAARAICIVDLTESVGGPGAEATRELLDLCLAEISDGMVLISADGRLLRSNVSARRILHLEEGRGSALWRQHPALIHDPIWAFVQEGETGRRQLRDERWVPALACWLAYSLMRVGDDTLFVFRDRSDVFGLRATLDEATTRFAAALDAGGASLLEMPLWVDSDHARLVGDVLEPIGSGERARFGEAVERALVEKVPVDITLQAASASPPCRVRVRAVIDHDEAGRPCRLRGLAHRLDHGDITSGPAVADGSGVTGAQVRAARGALRWSVRELSERSLVSVATINRFEAEARIGVARDSSIAALERALVAEGIRFFSRDGHAAISVTAPEVASLAQEAIVTPFARTA